MKSVVLFEDEAFVDLLPLLFWRSLFELQVGRKVILRAVPFRRENGTEKWVQEEEKRYTCTRCGNQLFRGAKRCNQCREPADVD